MGNISFWNATPLLENQVATYEQAELNAKISIESAV